MLLNETGAIFENLGELPFLIACLAALCVGLAKGGLSTIGMLAVPIISLVISPIKGAALLLPIYILSDLVGVWIYRRTFSARNLQILIPAGLLGVLVGWATASIISDRVVSMLIGCLGIGFCLYAWLWKIHQSTPTVPTVGRGVLWGSLAGFTSFISHAGSPPYQIYVIPQRLEKMVFAGTTTLVFAAINWAKLVPYIELHPYTPADLQLALWLVPVALTGTYLGAFLTKRIADAWFSRFVQLGLFLISINLIWQALYN